MRRRGPPSSLRLFQGPLPPRSHPKHILPSVPRPVFRPEASSFHGSSPVPRTRHAHPDYQIPLELELAAICRPDSSASSTPSSSPTKRVRGPWDDGSSFDIVMDVLAVPKPAAGV